MKTLNEVIYHMENLAYSPLTDDALHYLKEYRDYSKVVDERYAEIEKKQSDAYFMLVNAMAELERNDPLTWDELKQMEGKPVWVEIENNDPVWAIPMGISTLGDNERMCMVGAEGGHAIHVEVAKDSVNGWQAYRKERE